jgi:DNA-binding transcriptional ArsR family regulator
LKFNMNADRAADDLKLTHLHRIIQLAASTYFDICGDMEKMYAIAALSALAQDTRLDIFRLLVEAGADGAPAGMIAEKLALPSATLSFHLNQLKHARLVKFRRESRSLIYTAEYQVMNELLGYLTENCCQGDAAACGLAPCAPATNEEDDRDEAPACTRIGR